jgi:hypothetical protein
LAENNLTVVNEAGTVGTLSKAEYRAARKAGQTVRLATDDEKKDANLEAKYGGTGAGLRAFAEGALRGPSLGVSDALVDYFSPETAEGMGYRERKNPGAAIGGELAGIGLTSLLSGGTGAAATAARGVSAPLRGLTALGGMAERGAAALIGEGGGLGRRLLVRGASGVARGVTEGAGFGAGRVLTESAIGDHEMTSERALALLGTNAIVNSLVDCMKSVGN